MKTLSFNFSFIKFFAPLTAILIWSISQVAAFDTTKYDLLNKITYKVEFLCVLFNIFLNHFFLYSRILSHILLVFICLLQKCFDIDFLVLFSFYNPFYQSCAVFCNFHFFIFIIFLHSFFAAFMIITILHLLFVLFSIFVIIPFLLRLNLCCILYLQCKKIWKVLIFSPSELTTFWSLNQYFSLYSKVEL